MLKFTADNKAIMEFTLAHIGLLIVSAIILTAAISFISYNDMQKTNELKTVASQISTLVEAMEAKSMSDTTEYWLPDLGYDYTVTISTEYITVEAEGFWNKKLSVKQRFIIKPWVQNHNDLWMGGEEFHQYLHDTYQKSGTYEEPLRNINQITEDLENLKTSVSFNYASNPLTVDPSKPLILDKSVIYFLLKAYDECKDGTEYFDKAGDVKNVPNELGVIIMSEGYFKTATAKYKFGPLPDDLMLEQTISLLTITHCEDSVMGEGPELSFFNLISNTWVNYNPRHLGRTNKQYKISEFPINNLHEYIDANNEFKIKLFVPTDEIDKTRIKQLCFYTEEPTDQLTTQYSTVFLYQQ